MRSVRALAMGTAIGLAAVLLSAPSASFADTTVSLAPSADTYTASSAPTTNYGSSASLAAYGTPIITSVLRFSIPPSPAGQTLSGATLRLSTTDISSAGSAHSSNIRVATDTWSESSTVYTSRPTTSGPVLGTLQGGTVPNTRYGVSLTASALTPGSVTLAIEGTGSDSVWLWSRQAPLTATRPILELNFTDNAPSDSTAPSAPAGLATSVNGSTVALTWQPSTDNVGVTGYTVHRSDVSGFTPSSATAVGTASATSYNDTNRPPGSWHYRVTARDAVGNVSAPSSPATAVINSTAPPTTISLSPTADTYTSSSAASTNYGSSASLAAYSSPVITSLLRFTIPAPAAGQTLVGGVLRLTTTSLTSAGSVNAANIRIAADSWSEATTVYTDRPTVSGPVLGSVPSGTLPSTPYSVSLTAAGLPVGPVTLAIEGTGADSLWLWSRQAPSAVTRPVLQLSYSGGTATDTSAPTTPAGLTSSVSGSSVILGWQAATDDVGVTGYTVHRSTTAAFTPTAATSVGTTATTNYTDNNRPAGTWHYRVTASDAAGNTSGASAPTTAVVSTPGSSATVMAVGDIACQSGTPVTTTACRHGDVASLIRAAAPDRFIGLGDLQYQQATLAQFMAPGAYNDTFGPLKPITLPVLGNHEYLDNTNGYFDYFYGAGVTTGPLGTRPNGYYSTQVGSWTFIGLNTECGVGGVAGGCGVGSPQYTWLQSQLASSGSCTVVAAHRPRWSTGASHGSYPQMAALWDLMANNDVDVVLSGHNHVSEIFKPIGVSGASSTPTLDPEGIRAFTAGGGGANIQNLSAATDPLVTALEARSRIAFGPLKLVLGDGTYSWEFLPVSGMTFTNSGTTGTFSGSDNCH
ncbi:DNRLRE domain-containing protein [Mycetocola zhadangensis]|uniref:CBM96 family carbohydrate-binding protein n=1 Tax=Mycetocola zhadangensis TaxID=1164595 RepID=UPI003A4E094C